MAPKIQIIHTCPPIVVETDPANFRFVVQNLTGKRKRAPHCETLECSFEFANHPQLIAAKSDSTFDSCTYDVTQNLTERTFAQPFDEEVDSSGWEWNFCFSEDYHEDAVGKEEDSAFSSGSPENQREASWELKLENNLDEAVIYSCKNEAGKDTTTIRGMEMLVAEQFSLESIMDVIPAKSSSILDLQFSLEDLESFELESLPGLEDNETYCISAVSIVSNNCDGGFDDMMDCTCYSKL